MKTRSSSSPPLPLRSLSPESGGELQIVDPTWSHLQIPPGWGVVKRQRSSATGSHGRVDTYYIEPETGRKFPSLASVRRHLNGGKFLSLPPVRRHLDGGRLFERLMFKEMTDTKKMHRTAEYASRGFSLPEGWVIEAIPRKNSSTVDKYYIEPGTGTRFRSLISVERYLKATGNDTDEPEVMEHIEQFTLKTLDANENRLQLVPFRDHSPLPMNQNDTRLRNKVIEPNRPEKVKWVLTGPGGNMFRPYMNGSIVSGSVREQWSEAFVSFIQDRS